MLFDLPKQETPTSRYHVAYYTGQGQALILSIASVLFHQQSHQAIILSYPQELSQDA